MNSRNPPSGGSTGIDPPVLKMTDQKLFIIGGKIMTVGQEKKIIDFLLKKKAEGVEISYWRVTKKNVVVYDISDNRTLFPLSQIIDKDKQEERK